MKKLPRLNIKSVKHLALLLGSDELELTRLCEGLTRNADDYYRRGVIRKRGKRPRPSATPMGRFGSINSRLQDYLQRLLFPTGMHGGIRGKSTFTYAFPHTHKQILLKFDIKDCFPSISCHRVYRCFEKLGCTPDVSRLLTRLTTLDNQLPQGSPTSMIVANIVSANLARRLDMLANHVGASFGSYVDDIAFSGQFYISKLKSLILKIMRQEGFVPNASKTIEMSAETEQVVAGIKVNDGPDVPAEVLENARLLLGEFERDVQANIQLNESAVSSVMGKIRHVKRLNRGAGKFLLKRSRRLFPPHSNTPATHAS